jgi:hypothetical protein
MAQEADEQKPRWMEQLEEKQRAKAEAEAEAGLPVDSQDALQPEEGDPVEFADEPGTDPPINGPGAGIDAPIDAPVAQPPTETPVADGGDWLAEEAAPPFEPPRTSVEPPAVPPPPGLTPRTITPAVPPPPGLTPRTITPAAPPPAVPGPLGTETSVLEELEEVGIGRLRDDAIRYGRADADAGVPGVDSEGQPESERDLVERCRGFYDRWKATERRHRNAQVAEREQAISEKLGLGGLAVDKYERLTNELLRLKARLSVRRQEVASELDSIDDGPTRGLSTRVYAAAIGFLGVVEFFANAPVFTALLPRDPLTERQIRLVAETSEGWMAGAQRVFAHLILRPDAALLAAGVVTFLCVLAHFFGHSLRAAVQQRDQEERHHVSGRTQIENIIPMILSGVGLILVLGVLYEARVTLGEVGEQQYTQDMAVVEELRREAGWLRADGELLAANQRVNQADDMEAAATALREYASSMSRLSFPILLLNTTLVLCAISAAYFHRSVRRREHFNESPFDRERSGFIEAAESTAQEVASYLSSVTRDIRQLQSLSTTPVGEEQRSVIRRLESVIALYRAENGRARGADPRTIPAFRDPVVLGIEVEVGVEADAQPLRSPSEYDDERNQLRLRFEEARRRFNEDAIVWA